MKKPCLFFDLDNTILDFNTAEEKALGKALREAGLTLDAEKLAHYRRINEQCWQALERGEMSRERVLYGRYEQFFREEGFAAADPAAVQDRYEYILSHGHYFMPGAEALLNAFAENYRLFAVSNGNAVTQAGRIASAGLSQWFEDFFISEKIGAEKPSAAFFDYCFSHIAGAEKDSTVIIGDSLTSDILGGINAGIATVWYNFSHKAEPPAISPDYIIHELAELPPLLEKHFLNREKHFHEQ